MSYETAQERPEEASARRTQPDVRLDEPAGRPLPGDPAALLYPAEAAHILEGCGDPAPSVGGNLWSTVSRCSMSYRAAVARPHHPTEHLTQTDCFPDGPAGTPEHADLTASLHPAGIAPTHGLCCACKPSTAGTSSSAGFGRVSQGPPVARPESAAESSGRTGRPPDEPAGRPLPADPAALLYPAEAAHILGLSPRTLEHYRIAGGGPPYVSIGRRCVRYRRSDLIAWIDSRCRRHTSDPEPSR